MDYTNSEVQDYLNNDDFIRWALYSENDVHWQQILLEYPSQRVAVERARQLVIQLQEAQQPAKLPVHEERVWGVIREVIDTPERQPVINLAERSYRRRRLTPFVGWAALLVCVLGAGWFTINYKNHRVLSYNSLVAAVEQENELVEKVNTMNAPLRIPLEDGSVVTLAKHSRLSFPAHFDSRRREVILSGEAFFEIAKNPAKPFFVYANQVVTKVLGTSFRIRAFDGDRQVEVDVRTGRVSVFTQNQLRQYEKETNGVVLVPNQQALYNRENETIIKRLVANPVPLKSLPLAAKRHFDDVPVPMILQELEARYGVKILYNEDLLANCVITTSLGNEPLRDKLDIICQTIGATYKEIDAQLVVESNGCH